MIIKEKCKMVRQVSPQWNTKKDLNKILKRYRLKFFDNKVSSAIQLYEFDKMIGEILSQNIQCKFKNPRGYCKQRNNRSINDKYGMSCSENGCPYYSVPCLSIIE